MLKYIFIVMFILLLFSKSFGFIERKPIVTEADILLQVAEKYNLTEKETQLLLIIRRIENGNPGIEMGVGHGNKRHPARRYAGNFQRSLRLQAEWAAGTIKNRYRGNLYIFGKIYCPEELGNWYKNALFYMYN
jgi:hypothetical protein